MGDALAGFVGVWYNKGVPQYQETGMGKANPHISSAVDILSEGIRHIQSLRLEISSVPMYKLCFM